MVMLDNLLCALDQMLDSRRKRHITGGILLSVSMLFGGLAAPVFTMSKGEDDHE